MGQLYSRFLRQIKEQKALLVESPMDRYECCPHCVEGLHDLPPRHDGHADPCKCPAGSTMLGEYRKETANG